jgi:hypothetical protein
MDLPSIIDEIAGRADDFLADAANRREARAGIAELLNADYPQVKPADRRKVEEAVMAILEDEGFFGSARIDRRDDAAHGANGA